MNQQTTTVAVILILGVAAIGLLIAISAASSPRPPVPTSTLTQQPSPPTASSTATLQPTASSTTTPRPTDTTRPTATPTETPQPTFTPTLTLIPFTATAAPTPTLPPGTAAAPTPTLPPAHPPTITAGGDRRLGVVDAFDNPTAAAQLGAGWTRARFLWSAIQPNNAQEWNDADLQAIVNSETAAGRQVAALVVNTPPWALRDVGTAGVPRGLELPADNPENAWAQFIGQLVASYAGRVDHWIIWNEPDIWDNTYPGQTWGGTLDEFLQLQRIAYTVAKAANPNAVIHLAGFTFWWDTQSGRAPFFRRLMEAMANDPNAAGNNYYFDVATAHQYFRPDSVYSLTLWHHETMRTFGFDKPVWLVETNAAPSLDPAWPVPEPKFNVTLEDQAAFMVQAFAMGLAGGAERIAVYKLADTPGDHAANPEPFGLVRMDGTHRPAFASFQLAARYLAGYRSASLERRDTVVQVTVDRGTQVTTVLWARGAAQQVTLPARANSALVVDTRTGATRTLYPTDGNYTLDLPGATCTQPVEDVCMIGGWPILVIESK